MLSAELFIYCNSTKYPSLCWCSSTDSKRKWFAQIKEVWIDIAQSTGCCKGKISLYIAHIKYYYFQLNGKMKVRSKWSKRIFLSCRPRWLESSWHAHVFDALTTVCQRALNPGVVRLSVISFNNCSHQNLKRWMSKGPLSPVVTFWNRLLKI